MTHEWPIVWVYLPTYAQTAKLTIRSFLSFFPAACTAVPSELGIQGGRGEGRLEQPPSLYTANVYRDLRGSCRFFLRYLWKRVVGITEKPFHSMARANLNKSKKVLTSTTTASKYIPKRPRICINWNPPFQTQIYLVKVALNVNIVKQNLLK